MALSSLPYIPEKSGQVFYAQKPVAPITTGPTGYSTNKPGGNVRDTGGQVNIGDQFRNLFGGIVGGVNAWTQAKIYEEIYGMPPGANFDPLSAPYANPADGYPAPTQTPASNTNPLIFAALIGAAYVAFGR